MRSTSENAIMQVHKLMCQNERSVCGSCGGPRHKGEQLTSSLFAYEPRQEMGRTSRYIADHATPDDPYRRAYSSNSYVSREVWHVLLMFQMHLCAAAVLCIS